MSKIEAQTSAAKPAGATPGTGRLDGRTLAVLLSVTVSYTVVNTALRDVATTLNPYLVAAIRLLPLLLLTMTAASRSDGGLGGLFQRLNGSSQGRRTMLWLMVSGMFAYFIGNSIFQTALKIGGIGVGVPASQGGSIWGAIVIGFVLFGERATPGKLLGGVVMASGVAFLAMGKPSFGGQAGISGAIVAIALAVAAGVSWTSTGIVLRKLAYPLGLTTMQALMFNAIGGLLLLIPATLWTAGPTLSNAPRTALVTVAIAGMFNACALLGNGWAIKRTAFVTVNLFSSSSIAFSSLLGILIFHEPSNAYVWSGLTAVLAGLAIVQLAPVSTAKGR